MELALGAFATMFSGAGAAATAATSAAAWAAGTTVTTAAGVTSGLGAAAGLGALGSAALAALPAVSTVAGLGSLGLSILQGAATAGSVMTQLEGGKVAMQEANLQASNTELQARERALLIRKEEIEKIGAARVGFAASGVSLGSAASVESALRDDSNYQRRLTHNSGVVEAGQIRLRGKGSLLAAAGGAAGTSANYLIDLARRG